MIEETIICADPSCFVSLKNQTEFLKIIDYENESRCTSITIVIPTLIYDALQKQPKEKFPLLESILNDWSKTDDGIKFGILEKSRYVNNTRKLLNNFHVKPAKYLTDDIEKLGSNSIYPKDVKEKLGAITGDIIFEIMATSYTAESSIVAFGTKQYL